MEYKGWMIANTGEPQEGDLIGVYKDHDAWLRFDAVYKCSSEGEAKRWIDEHSIQMSGDMMEIPNHEHGEHECYCPSCFTRTIVGVGVRCNEQPCSQCGTLMVATGVGECQEPSRLSLGQARGWPSCQADVDGAVYKYRARLSQAAERSEAGYRRYLEDKLHEGER